MRPYNQKARQSVTVEGIPIESFEIRTSGANIDEEVVTSFGEEWSKFNQFDEEDLQKIQAEYFDIITDKIIDKNSYGIDIGCGTGRWTKCLAPRAGFMEAIDPSDAVFTAAKLLKEQKNVRVTRASIDNIPFDDNTFDFGMSIGVLHHIPDTQKALIDCIKKIRIGGYFYVYLYYSLDNRSGLFRAVFTLSNIVRRVVSKLPGKTKRITSDILAVGLYMPFILTGRLMKTVGLRSLAQSLPLSPYQNKSFHIIRNDALDRFGTSLEQRFSKKEVVAMMTQAGLAEITVSEHMPYWHAIGKRIK